MSVHINGALYGKPYINGIKHNGYCNGKRIWITYPPGALIADEGGQITVSSSATCCDYSEFGDWECWGDPGVTMTIYSPLGTIVSTGNFVAGQITIGKGNYALINDYICA